MKIAEVLKNDEIYDVRVTYGNRWIAWEDDSWFVLEHKYYAKKTTVIKVTKDEDEAVAALVEEG